MTYGITNAGGGKSADLGTKTITANDTYLATDDGLDGYSEVTVAVPAPAPNLQSKIARQNGLVTADDGYQGLSSVDVGVGQVGETYEANNKSGSALVANQKVWLNYREPTSGSVTTIASDSSTDNSHAGFGCATSPNGSYIYYINAFRRLNAYNVNNGNNTDSLASFDATYCLYTLDDGTQLINHKSGTLKLQDNTAVSYSSYVQKYHNIRMSGTTIGVKVNDNWVSYSGSATAYNGSSCSALVNGQPTLYFIYNTSSRYYISKPTFNDSEHTYSVSHYVDLGTSNTNAKAIGSTNDGKYVIFGSSAITAAGYNEDFTIYKVNQETGGLAAFSPNTTGFNSLVTPKCAIFDNFNNILSCCDTSGHSAVIKYNPANDTWEDVTISGYSGTVKGPLWLSADMTLGAGRSGYNNFSGFKAYKFTIANTGGWNITSYGNITSNSLTGYAAEPIASLANGDVIVGTRVDGTAITATNNSAYDRENGEKVWLYANNGSYEIVNSLGLTSNAFTGICKEAIAIGASGAVEATIGGNLVVRWTRDFTNSGGSVDDGARTFTSTANFSSIKKQFSDALPVPTTEVEYMVKLQLTSNPYSGAGSAGAMYAYITSGGSSTEAITYVDMGTSSFTPQSYTYKNTSGVVHNTVAGTFQLNTWYWFRQKITTTSSILEVSTDGVNFSGGTSLAFDGFGKFASKYDIILGGGSFKGIIDLAETYLKVDGDIVWQPYTPITE